MERALWTRALAQALLGKRAMRPMSGRLRAYSAPFPAVMLIAAGAAMLTACGSGRAPSRPAELTRTTQVHVSPVGADGRPVPGFRTTMTASQAGCIPGSEAIGEAYRCFAGNSLYDPCWAERAATPTVLCLPDPWSVTDVRLRVDAQLSAIPAVTATEPWGVELASGQRCVLVQGAHSQFDGRVIDYYCTSRLWLLRGLTTSSAVWRAASVTVTGGRQAAGASEQIKVAWFGRPDSYR